MTVVPGGFDEQPAGVLVAAFGDVPAVLLVAGGVLRRGQAEVAHQLARRGEAPDVADLGEQTERRPRRDRAKAAQPCDRVRPRVARRDLLEFVIDDGDLCVEAVEVAEHVLDGALRELVVESLSAHPRVVLSSPGFLSVSEDVAVAQQRLGDAVTRREPGAHEIVAAAHEVTQAFLLRRWGRDERQLAGAIQPHELLGVTPVGLDPCRPHGPAPATVRSHRTPRPDGRAAAADQRALIYLTHREIRRSRHGRAGMTDWAQWMIVSVASWPRVNVLRSSGSSTYQQRTMTL